jgi:hypothetical protein
MDKIKSNAYGIKALLAKHQRHGGPHLNYHLPKELVPLSIVLLYKDPSLALTQLTQ